MRFQIDFHSPFRIAAGRAGDGADTIVDPTMPLPASSLKGVMRSAARDLLMLDQRWVDTVFGAAWQPSPWNWSDAAPADGGQIRLRARVQIDEQTHTATDKALVIAEEIVVGHAEFSITRAGWIRPELRQAHQNVLVVAARAVTALGGDRRRGLGWVSVTPLDPPWPADDNDADAHITGLIDALASLPDPGADR